MQELLQQNGVHSSYSVLEVITNIDLWETDQVY